MAEIFISYKSERRAAAEHFAEVLKRYGYSVWFDYELVKGKDFAAQIERQIRGARALVALWCALSVTSRWVREEVHLAHDLGILVPVKIEPCEIPFGFRLADTIDLSAWDGAPRSPALDPLIDALEGRVGRDAAPDRKALMEYEATWRRFGAHPLKDFTLNTKLAQAEARRFGPDELNGPDNGLLQWSKEEWERLEDSADADGIRLFADHAHPYYAALARTRIEALAAKVVRNTEAEKTRREAERLSEEYLARKRGMRILLEGAEIKFEKPPQTQPAPETATPSATAAPGTPSASLWIDAPVSNGKDGWFVPGAGKREWFKDLDVGPEMVVIPAGWFTMGSPPEELERWDAEGPQHKVTIAKPFAMGRCAVTFEEWDAAQQDKDWQKITGLAPYKPSDQGWGRDRCPAINVSWEDATAYVKWLSEKTGMAYGLPSEAEWEYACRAGTQTQFWWGDGIYTDQANYDGNYNYFGGQRGEYRQKTVPVESFEPNPWGLYQVHGNVWEWCEDCWNGNYHNAPTYGEAWTSGDGSLRVLRGGSWASIPQNSPLRQPPHERVR